MAWIGRDLHRPFGNLVVRSDIVVGDGPAILLMDLLACRKVLRAEARHGACPLIGEATQGIIVFEVGLGIAGDDEPVRLRHGRKTSKEISARQPDEGAMLDILSGLQHRDWNTLADKLVRRHCARWAAAYDNNAAIVTHPISSKLLCLACLASFGGTRHGVGEPQPRSRNRDGRRSEGRSIFVAYFEGAGRGFGGQRNHLFQLKWGGIAMLGVVIAPTLASGHSRGSASDFWCLVGLPGRDNMEGPTARKLTSIRRLMKIKFLVIGKLANN